MVSKLAKLNRLAPVKVFRSNLNGVVVSGLVCVRIAIMMPCVFVHSELNND